MSDGSQDAYKYELIVYWSAEDGAFVVDVPELPGCMADGPTPAGHATHRAPNANEIESVTPVT